MLCKKIQATASGMETKSESANNISILINNVEKFDPRKGKVHKATDDELLVTANANTFP